MKTQELQIEGMSCGHCVMSLKKQLSKIDGLEVNDVTIGKASVQFDETRVSPELLKNAIETAGFQLVN